MANALSRRLRTTLFYALRTAFRLTPMPQGTRDRLRERFLDTKGHWVPEGPKGQPPTGDLPRRPYVRSDERAIGYVPYEKGELPDPLPATLVAFYLPQFHTIPENDEWWGKGFTEWRNVTRALPQFEGHYQPKLPGDLGFYDLRNVEVMHEQARLAREYGISAFCFYFYWFGGKTLLETPLRNWLNDKTIDLKFCLCWANEKWTRTWDGRGGEILIDQQHSPEDDIAFIEHVAEYMRDPRYLRVDGKPVLVIYRPGLMPDMQATARRWRNWCASQGIGEILLSYTQSFDSAPSSELGLDKAISFPPNQHQLPSMAQQQELWNADFSGEVLDWRLLSRDISSVSADEDRYPGINPGWDNEARRPGRGRVLLHSSPRAYRDWLQEIIESDRAESKLVFINAWNEWAEGATLEPDARLGYANLKATRDALSAAAYDLQITVEASNEKIHAVLHAWHIEAMREIVCVLTETRTRWQLTVTTVARLEAEVRSILEDAGLAFTIIVVQNHGRDILPFLIAAEFLAQRGVKFALKLHTKRSLHRTDGDMWRRDLVSKLAAGNQVRAATALLTEQRGVGLIAPAGHVVGLDYYWGANETATRSLARRIGLPNIDSTQQTFVSGSMFWFRLEAIRPILDTHFLASEFETEIGQVDGTLAHAFERIFQHCVESYGYRTVVIDEDQALQPVPPRTNHYPYATR